MAIVGEERAIAYPIGVAVTCEHNVVADLVVVQVLESTVAVGHVAL